MAGFLSASFPRLPQFVKASLLNSSDTIPVYSPNLLSARSLTDTLRQNQLIKSALLWGKETVKAYLISITRNITDILKTNIFKTNYININRRYREINIL